MPRAAHATWSPPADRSDPVAVITAQDAQRVPHLVPLRHERMAQSPFSFYRGSAAIMALDLASTPASGERVQAGGDCHVANFGAFATPERNFIFDVNDFDETLPAPWEWDVKRLAASVVLAARELGLAQKRCKKAATGAARSYRESVRLFAERTALEVWFTRIDAADIVARFNAKKTKDVSTRLVSDEHGTFHIVDNPPLVEHFAPNEPFAAEARETLARYERTLRDDIRVLFSRYRLVDQATKVVGVGSVGTRCAIMLLQGTHENALLLQVKEATASVLEPVAGKSRYANHGERVVTGQRLMQTASDLFLGWTSIDDRDYYIRRYHDMKAAVDLTRMDERDLAQYGKICGEALALGHARSGDAACIAGYLGNAAEFDDAIGEFAVAYADQTERDYSAFKAAGLGSR